jgi:hypothetical protein
VGGQPARELPRRGPLIGTARFELATPCSRSISTHFAAGHGRSRIVPFEAAFVAPERPQVHRCTRGFALLLCQERVTASAVRRAIEASDSGAHRP